MTTSRQSAPLDWLQVKALFFACLDLPPNERAAFLDSHAQSGSEVHILLSEMLDRHFLDVQGFEDNPHFQSLPERIGPFKIQSLVAKTLNSLVLKAVRDDGQFDQTVAIKLLQPNATSLHALLRLESERHILATLNHPSICRLLDSGKLPNGQHYLILEWIDGVSFLDHAKSFAFREKLLLFRQICLVLEAAHRLLIVHRDLKPAHILITPPGELKILDFGIAKLLPAAPSEDSQLTEYGQTALTPAYASPEQWRGDPPTPSIDIFSLGILFVELISGQHPFGPSPALPHEWATRVSSGPPAHLTILPSGIRSIASKAIQSSPLDRYPTVEAFRRDIDNYLDGKPLSARPRHPLYVAALWLRRNRSLCLVAIVLLSLGIFESLQWWTRRQTAFVIAQQAQQSARELVLQTFDALTGTNVPRQTRRQILNAAIRQLELWESTSPSPVELKEVAALYGNIAGFLGESFADNLEEYAQAERYARHAVEIWDSLPSAAAIDRINAHMLLADVLFSHSKFAEAREEYSLAQARLLALPDSNSLSNQLYLSVMRSMLGDILLAEGNPAAALPIQKAILTRRLELYQVSNGVINELPVAHTLGNVHTSLAQTHAALDQLPAAILHAAQAIKEFTKAATIKPYPRELTAAYLYLGDLHKRNNQQAAALAAWRQAKLLAIALLAEDPANLQRRRLLDDANRRLSPAP